MTPMEKATEAVLNQFLGGSSGLDELAESIAKDHAEAAVTAYLTALSEDVEMETAVRKAICCPDGCNPKRISRQRCACAEFDDEATAVFTALASRDGEKS